LLEANLDGSAAFYTGYKQLIIRAYRLQLPLLAGFGILTSLDVLYLSRRDKVTVWLTSAAILFLTVGLVITLTVHFPINDQMLDWSPHGLLPTGKPFAIGGGTPSSGAHQRSSASYSC
jgi:hypothetical protein